MLRLTLLLSWLVVPAFVATSEPCVSGLQVGQRPGPYAALVAVGPQRGQSHCFICETADRPAVIVFARRMTHPLGTLLKELDQSLIKHEDAGLRSWATFLTNDQPALEPQIMDWARRLGLANLSLGIFEDQKGPPSYRISDAADVTVLLTNKRKVIGNFAFRDGELTGERASEVIAAVTKMLAK